jgi:hypothetical protein
MRAPKEIVVLIVLLLLAMASVLWYVIDRRARQHAAPPVAVQPSGPAPQPSAAAPDSRVSPGQPPTPAPAPASPVDLAKHDGQTIDFSSGQPVVKQSAADKAALDAGLKDIADATKDVTFDPPKPANPPPATGKP